MSDDLGIDTTPAHTSDGKERSNSRKPSDPLDTYNVTAGELKQFYERYNQLEAEKKDVSEQQKELIAEMKGRGFDTKVFKMVVAHMKRNPDEIAETESIKDMYLAALGFM